jgi:SAM-dependent methyltransferase
MVENLDGVALHTAERVIGTLIVEPQPVILDLMASLDSHLPESLAPGRVVGLGLNSVELEQNQALDARVVHDLNRDPTLPFDDETFDVVLNTVSVEYLTQPVEVFAEVARVLKPGGLHLVVLSNRMFPTKAVKIWSESTDRERVWLVEDYFTHVTDAFDKPQIFSSQGKVRPTDDPYADRGIPSDPVTAVYADKRGGAADRAPRPEIPSELGDPIDADELARRKEQVGKTLECPYCQEPFHKLDLEQSPFLEWDLEFVYICLNNRCSYYVTSWEEMRAQGNIGFSCRLLYDPVRDRCRPTPDVNGHANLAGRLSPRG